MADRREDSINSAKFWAGQTDDPFFVDLGSIFDLAGLRPFNSAPRHPARRRGRRRRAQVDTTSCTIALQVPITSLTSDHTAHTADNAKATVGIWAVAQRRKTTTHRQPTAARPDRGPWVQVSRLGNPLINEVIIPVGLKDVWNRRDPYKDKDVREVLPRPGAGGGSPTRLYPALDDADTTGRTDLSLILLNGLPGVNSTGAVKADMLRLNTGHPAVHGRPGR